MKKEDVQAKLKIIRIRDMLVDAIRCRDLRGRVRWLKGH